MHPGFTGSSEGFISGEGLDLEIVVEHEAECGVEGQVGCIFIIFSVAGVCGYAVWLVGQSGQSLCLKLEAPADVDVVEPADGSSVHVGCEAGGICQGVGGQSCCHADARDNRDVCGKSEYTASDDLLTVNESVASSEDEPSSEICLCYIMP